MLCVRAWTMEKTTAARICLAILYLQSLLLCCACGERALIQYRPDTFLQDSETHVIRKRPTVLLNRLMYALQKVVQPDEQVTRQHQELERRGYPKHYWKCYFNAVSCFRRKREVISQKL